MTKKKILLIVLPIILIIVGLAIGATLYFTTDLFKSNEQLFSKYFMQNGELFSIIENENAKAQSKFKTNNTYTMAGSLSTTVQDGSNAQEINAVTSSRHDSQTGRTYSDITLKNGETDTLTVSYINSDDVYAIKCDDIIPNYIGIRNNELNKFMQNMGVADVTKIPSSINLEMLSDISDITDEQKQHIINTYSKVIRDSISKEKFTKLGKKEITIENNNYNANTYKVELDSNTLKQIAVNCLSTLKDDNITLVVLSNKFTILGLEEEYTDITKLSEKINNILTKIQQDNSNDVKNIIITVYECKGKTIRTEIELNEEDTESILSSDNTIENNTQTVQENTTKNTYTITIDKTTNGNTSNANVTVSSNKVQNNGKSENNTMQISLSKTKTDSNVVNDVTIIPDINNMAETLKMTTTIGKENSNTISSSSNVTASISSDGINVQTIQSLYNQTIEKADQVNEIMELKNSNTVIANNYSKEQLLPFLGQVVIKGGQVIPAKLAQLGIDLSNQNTNGNIATNKLAEILATSTLSIVGTNNANISNILTTGATALTAEFIKEQSKMSEMVIDTVQQ